LRDFLREDASTDGDTVSLNFSRGKVHTPSSKRICLLPEPAAIFMCACGECRGCSGVGFVVVVNDLQPLDLVVVSVCAQIIPHPKVRSRGLYPIFVLALTSAKTFPRLYHAWTFARLSFGCRKANLGTMTWKAVYSCAGMTSP
jgi:hypothetical protein